MVELVVCGEVGVWCGGVLCEYIGGGVCVGVLVVVFVWDLWCGGVLTVVGWCLGVEREW